MYVKKYYYVCYYFFLYNDIRKKNFFKVIKIKLVICNFNIFVYV